MKTTLETLRKDNAGYAYGAMSITNRDLDLVNDIIERIEQTRTKEPQKLDAVEYTNEWGNYFANAIIDGDTYYDGSMVICEGGSAYVSIDRNGVLRESISGGAFPRVDKSKMRYKGKKEKMFWTFSTMGAGANQGLYFKAEVSCFELNVRDEKFKNFTTKDYDCIIVTDQKNRTLPNGYKYTVDRSNCGSYAMCAFKDESELKEFLELYEAVEEPYFKNNDGRRKYWILKSDFVSVWTQEEFDKIESDRAHKYIFNGRKVPAKFVKSGTTLKHFVLRSNETRYGD